MSHLTKMEWIEQERKRIAEEKKLNPPKPRRKKRGRPKKRKYKYEKTRTYPPFQEAYRKLLAREGMTQKSLAAALGIDPSLVGRELKRANYIDPKLREYVEMLGYRIVLSFEKVGEPHIVPRVKSDKVLKAIEGKREKMSGGSIPHLDEERTDEELKEIAERNGEDTSVDEPIKVVIDTEQIASKYSDMDL